MIESSRPKRILVAEPYPWGLKSIGGVPDCAREQIDILRQMGHEVTSLGPHLPAFEYWINKDKNFAQEKMGIAFRFGRVMETKGWFSASFNPILGWWIMNKVRPDLTIFHEPATYFPVVHTLISSARRFKPTRDMGVVYWTHAVLGTEYEQAHRLREIALWVGEHLKRPKGILNPVEGFGLTPGMANTLRNNADGIVAVSKAAAVAGRFNWHLRADQIIYNPIDTELMNPHAGKDLLGSNDEFVIVTAGRLEGRKNTKDIIKAVELAYQEVPNIRLVIVGKGPEERSLRQMVEDNHVLKRIVKFQEPFSDKRDLAACFAGADAFAAYSDGNEAFARVIAEALACGTPVLVSDIRGHDEAAGGHNQPYSTLVPPSNPGLLAIAMIQAARRSKEENRARGLIGREAVERNFGHESNRITTQYYLENIFEKVDMRKLARAA